MSMWFAENLGVLNEKRCKRTVWDRYLQVVIVKLDAINAALLYRHGAGAARRAHNPEVTRSKRVAGIKII